MKTLTPLTAKYQEIQFSDADIVNEGDFIPAGQSNPHNRRPFLFHDHGFALAVVFADCLDEALDEAADAGKLDRYLITECDRGDYKDENGISFLGNHGREFDIESLGICELPNPGFSFVALLQSWLTQTKDKQ